MHAAVGHDRHGGRAAADQLGGHDIVAAFFLAHGSRNIGRHRIGGARVSGAELRGRLRIEHIAPLAHVDLGLEMRDLEAIVALLEHSPERHVRRIAVAGHVERRHPERERLQLDRLLAGEKCLARERVDLRDLLVGHGIAADGGAVAVDHQKGAGAPVRPVIGIREPGVDRKIVAGVRIHLPGAEGIEALGCLAIALLDLGAEPARPAADGIGAEEREASAVVLLPDLELRFLLEDPQQHRRALRHALGLELGEHLLRQRLQMTLAGGRRGVGIASGKRYRCRDRAQRQQPSQHGPRAKGK